MSEEIRNNVIDVNNSSGDETQQDYSSIRSIASVLGAILLLRTLLKSNADLTTLVVMRLVQFGCLSIDNDDDDDRAPGADDGGEAGPLLSFTAVPPSEYDDIVVLEGYSFQVILPWGTAILGSMPPFAIDNTGEEQAMQMGS